MTFEKPIILSVHTVAVDLGIFTKLVETGKPTSADGLAETSKNVNIAAGAFAFASGMLGYYTVANLMCQEALGFSFPMGDTSRFFKKKRS